MLQNTPRKRKMRRLLRLPPPLSARKRGKGLHGALLLPLALLLVILLSKSSYSYSSSCALRPVPCARRPPPAPAPDPDLSLHLLETGEEEVKDPSSPMKRRWTTVRRPSLWHPSFFLRPFTLLLPLLHTPLAPPPPSPPRALMHVLEVFHVPAQADCCILFVLFGPLHIFCIVAAVSQHLHPRD